MARSESRAYRLRSSPPENEKGPHPSLDVALYPPAPVGGKDGVFSILNSYCSERLIVRTLSYKDGVAPV